ncbi:cytochrome c oxidase assembly protein COX14 isoform X1 [Bufo gargarizans]|uniref:cytochrome c oxidase assembly protein COX14 isoform X1 n=1 Tax=Bufo gargarizans TaxID=30331 RepID=UPI001CF3216E|nr:cytochrome c oxidase assembly protein COX14 isoform X1 [Bufo gargarizans]
MRTERRGDNNRGLQITMASSKRMADLGYKMFSGTMMLLTLYGGYLCSIRAYRYFKRQEQLQAAAENQTEAILKD